MGYLLKQNQTAQPLLFQMIDSTDHISGKTGLSLTVTISKNGAAFATPAGAVTEIANGWYQVAGNATDENTLGPLIVHATGAGADPTDELFHVVAFDPLAVAGLGLTNLDATVSSRLAASSYTAPDNADIATILTDAAAIKAQTDKLTFDASNFVKSNCQAFLASADPRVVQQGTAQAGGASTITLAAGASATNNLYQYLEIRITGGTGAGQTRTIVASGYNGTTKVATVDQAWTVQPDATSQYEVLDYESVPPPTAPAIATAINGIGLVLASNGLDNIMIEAGINARQALSEIGSAVCGTVSGMDTGSPVFKGMGNATTRISGTTDASGNRLTSVLSPPA